MEKIILLLSLLAAAIAVPATGFANLVLDMPPILASDNSCIQYTGCPDGPCYPTCPDPCVSCCDSSSSCDPCNPSTCADSNPCATCTVSLNDTGIVGSIATNDDAQYGRDKEYNNNIDGHAGFSFIKEGGTCVKDNVTGLLWSPDQGATNWSGVAAIKNTANAGLCGKSDWRLPTVKELVSIASYHRSAPAIDNDATRNLFTDTQNKFYWTETVDAGDGTKQWIVNFNTGEAANAINTDSLTVHRVRLVSGAKVANSFTDNGDTITDSSTSLTWKKCLEGLSGASCTTGTATAYTWSQALALTANGWRVPNIKELQSIVDVSKVNPAIDTATFPTTLTGDFFVWSASPYAVNTNPWIINFRYGSFFNVLLQTGSAYVRLVK